MLGADKATADVRWLALLPTETVTEVSLFDQRPAPEIPTVIGPRQRAPLACPRCRGDQLCQCSHGLAALRARTRDAMAYAECRCSLRVTAVTRDAALAAITPHLSAHGAEVTS